VGVGRVWSFMTTSIFFLPERNEARFEDPVGCERDLAMEHSSDGVPFGETTSIGLLSLSTSLIEDCPYGISIFKVNSHSTPLSYEWRHRLIILQKLLSHSLTSSRPAVESPTSLLSADVTATTKNWSTSIPQTPLYLGCVQPRTILGKRSTQANVGRMHTAIVEVTERLTILGENP
jgi:hypothetical protein